MELLPGFFGMLMVFVIYIAVGIDGLVYDATCTADGDCTDTNANICIDDSGTLKCKCNADSFRRASPAGCVIKIVAGSTCVAGDTCADTNAECDATALKCECTSTYFQKNDNTCATKVAALDGTCVTAETATDQCAIADSECRTNQCLCKDTHFRSGTTCTTKVAALEEACSTAETATDQCAVADSECRTDQCLCKATHYKDGAACTARIAPEDDCTGDQCVEHAACDSTCKCDAGYTASPATNPTMCSGVVKFASLSYMYVVPILVSTMSLLR